MNNRNIFDPLLLFLTAMTLWLYVLSGPPVHSEETRTPPRIQLEPKDDWIPYCPTMPVGHPQTFYPCMYSDRSHEA